MNGNQEKLVGGLRLRFEIKPEPSLDEAAAIVIAIKKLKASEKLEAVPQLSGWRLAARREALHDALPDGWRLAARLER